MVRILYTVCGIGMGHATRSTPLLEALAKKHDVFVTSYGPAYDFLNERFNTLEQFKWFKLIFNEERIQKSHTLMYNLPLLPYVAAKNLQNAYKMVRDFKPEVIISDFDMNGVYMGQLFRIPSIVISNMHLMNYKMIPLSTQEKLTYYLTEKPILDFFNAANHLIVSSLVKPNLCETKTSFFHPIVRKVFLNQKPIDAEQGDHIIVYSTPKQLTRIIPMLKNLKEKFIVYGYDQDSKEGNVETKKFSNDNFIPDLLNAKAVFSHGGISMLSESAVLKKPSYTFTGKSFFERYYNGAIVADQDWGEVHEKPNEKTLQGFIDKIPQYAESLRKSNISADNKAVVSKLHSLIRERTN